jgi:predicted choloylglycine hydrolase
MRTYKINLLTDAEKRWLPITEKEKRNARRLIKNAQEKLRFSSILKPVINKLCDYIAGESEYAEDIKTIAKLLKVQEGAVICGNLEYELAMCGLTNPFACTAAAVYTPKLGMLHVRNLDWPGEYIGRYTIKVVYQSHFGNFIAVTWPGYVGVLSAVAENRFSATISLLPWPGFDWLPKPNIFGWPASFLLRYIFENCASFEDALKEIKITPVVAPVIITLVGPERGQAVAIEKGTKDYKVREYQEPALVVTNHPVEDEDDRSYYDLWEDDGYNYTFRRKLILEEKVKTAKIKKLSDAFRLLNYKSIFNDHTAQSMVFNIKTGKALIRTFHDDPLLIGLLVTYMQISLKKRLQNIFLRKKHKQSVLKNENP